MFHVFFIDDYCLQEIVGILRVFKIICFVMYPITQSMQLVEIEHQFIVF